MSLIPRAVALLGGVIAIVPQVLPEEPDCRTYIEKLTAVDQAVSDRNEAGLAEALNLDETECLPPDVLFDRVVDVPPTAG